MTSSSALMAVSRPKSRISSSSIPATCASRCTVRCAPRSFINSSSSVTSTKHRRSRTRTNTPRDMRLRVVTWNVHGCVGIDRVFDPHRTAAALGTLQPDVALLQEVGDNTGVHPPIDQASHLANELGLTCAVGITLRASEHGYGNATLTRLPVLDSESVDLSYVGREPRLCLRVVVGRDGLRLTTLNVHLGLGADER